MNERRTNEYKRKKNTKVWLPSWSKTHPVCIWGSLDPTYVLNYNIPGSLKHILLWIIHQFMFQFHSGTLTEKKKRKKVQKLSINI